MTTLRPAPPTPPPAHAALQAPDPLPPLPPQTARDWILPVIADLARFAALNRLPDLAADLERCLQAARGGAPPA